MIKILAGVMYLACTALLGTAVYSFYTFQTSAGVVTFMLSVLWGSAGTVTALKGEKL